MKSNWFVISGAPSAGKTTTVHLLKQRGYETTYETARLYYESQIKKGLTSEQIRSDPQTLEDNILKLQIELEEKYKPEQLLFLDIAVPDTYAYYEFNKIKVPEALFTDTTGRYNTVFFLETVNIEYDEVRRETEDQIKIIEELILKQYKKLGLEPIRIPKMTQTERVDLILNYVKKFSLAI